MIGACLRNNDSMHVFPRATPLAVSGAMPPLQKQRAPVSGAFVAGETNSSGIAAFRETAASQANHYSSNSRSGSAAFLPPATPLQRGSITHSPSHSTAGGSSGGTSAPAPMMNTDADRGDDVRLHVRHPNADYVFVNHNNNNSGGSGARAGFQPRDRKPSRQSLASVLTFGAPNEPLHGGGAAAPPRLSHAPPAHLYRGRVQDGQQPTTGSSSTLQVEGVRTGEEVVVEPTVPRKRGSTEHDGGGDLEDGNLRRQLARERAEVRALTQKLQQKSTKGQRARAQLQLALDEAAARRVLEDAAWLGREAVLWSLTVHAIQEGPSVVAQAQQDLERAKVGLQRSFDAQNTAAELARANLASTLEALKKQQESERDQWAQDLAAARSELERERERLSLEKQQVECELAGARETHRKVIDELRAKDAARDVEGFLVAQCRLFIKHICQPGFNVVKGTSLEPVDRDRSEPSGYVLVPLPTLLHGYALLPEKERRDVIEHYEKQGKALQ